MIGRVAEPAGIFPCPAGRAAARADDSRRVPGEIDGRVAHGLGIDGGAREVDQRQPRIGRQRHRAERRSAARSRAMSLRPDCSVGGLGSAPISRAKRAAPSPTRSSCGSRFISARATLIGCAKPSSAPTAPLRRVLPSMTAASSCKVPSNIRPAVRADAMDRSGRPRPAGCRPRSRRAPAAPPSSSRAAVSEAGRAFAIGKQDHGVSASRFGCAILVRNLWMRGSCALPKNCIDRLIGDQLARLHEERAIGDPPRELHLVGDEDHRGAGLGERAR